MAVIVKYVVERDGVEKMTFTSKKDADAYDKMLDVADSLSDFIMSSPIEINDGIAEELSLFLAQNSPSLQHILKGGKVKPKIETEALGNEKTPKVKKAPKTTAKKAA